MILSAFPFIAQTNFWAFFELLVFEFDQLRWSPALLVRLRLASRANTLRLVTLQEKSLNEALVVDSRKGLFVVNMVSVALMAVGR